MRWLWIPVAAATAGGCAEPTDTAFESGRWVDLTHEFSEQTLYWPTSDTFELDVLFHDFTEAGFFYSSNRFRTAEHGGTHVDAPIHFAQNAWTLEEIPVERLVGPGAVVDVSEAASRDRDYLVTIDDLLAWESAHGRIPDGAILLLHTGFGSRWPDAASYLGTAARGAEAVADLHFPGLAPEAAAWLLAERNVHAVGLDTPSIDHGPSTLFESHQILFAANVPAFENVANLDALPPTGSFVIALPMKIRDGSGGPLRIVAFVPDSG